MKRPEMREVERSIYAFVLSARRPPSIVDVVALGSTAKNRRQPDEYRRAALRMVDAGHLRLERDLTFSVAENEE